MSSAQPNPILDSLTQGAIGVDGRFLAGSNYTLLTQVTHAGQTFNAVYKPVRGERPLWDFPSETLAGREVAAYLVSEAIGWDFVPPTVLREDGPSGPGSLQLFVEHNPEYHYFNFSATDRQRLRRVALFDTLVNNTDRKGGHLLVDESDKIWLIDHGICFHAQPKLRTVIWDFAGQVIPDDMCKEVSALLSNLEESTELHASLQAHLSHRELRALRSRTENLINNAHFPTPSDSERAYPWPPV